MAYEGETLDANLAAVAGDDPALFADLRQAFVESAERQLDLLCRARCDGNWQVAAWRLRGLAASFHAQPLMTLAEEAVESVPGDPVILRRIRRCLDHFGPTAG
jgi:hypothetical protein